MFEKKAKMSHSTDLQKCEIPKIVILPNFHHFLQFGAKKLDEFV
jgi:hypothetical protein